MEESVSVEIWSSSIAIDSSAVIVGVESDSDSIDLSNKRGVADVSKTGSAAACNSRFVGVCRLGSGAYNAECAMAATCTGNNTLGSVPQAMCAKGQANDVS